MSCQDQGERWGLLQVHREERWGFLQRGWWFSEARGRDSVFWEWNCSVVVERGVYLVVLGRLVGMER